jgi:hypothetical protein
MTRPRVCLWILPLLAAVPAVAQGPQAQGKGRLTGHIVSSLAGSPIPGAAVELDSTSWKTATDSAGAFHFDSVTPGVYLLQVRAIGYEPGTWRVRLRPDQPLDHAFQLDPAAISLPEVGVKGRTPQLMRRFADFERRRHGGMGVFLTQEQIEQAGTSNLVDILVTVRGVQQVCLQNDCLPKMVRSPPGCYPQYFIDGIESTAYFARLTPPGDIRGVEVYRGSSEIPGEYGGSNSACGVIAIWTKSSP